MIVQQEISWGSMVNISLVLPCQTKGKQILNLQHAYEVLLAGGPGQTDVFAPNVSCGTSESRSAQVK